MSRWQISTANLQDNLSFWFNNNNNNNKKNDPFLSFKWRESTKTRWWFNYSKMV